MLLFGYPRNVLILGGGDGLAIREVRKYPGVERIVLADLDPDMIKFASTNETMRRLNKDAFRSPQVHKISMGTTPGDIYSVMEGNEIEDQLRVFTVDAQGFLNKLPDIKFDVVILDFPDPSTLNLSHLYATEFFVKLSHHMYPNSIGVIQSTSPYYAKDAFLSIRDTLINSGFHVRPYRQDVPSFGDWGFNMFSVDLPVDDDQWLENKLEYTKIRIPTRFLNDSILHACFAFGKGELIPQHECINTWINPCVYKIYNQYGWNTD
jgi:spermidine synthase